MRMRRSPVEVTCLKTGSHMISNQYKDVYEAIYEIVRLIPAGRVSSYGAIAAAIGMKSGARMVGYSMHHCITASPPVPAHRVVNSKGMLSGKHHFGNGQEMQQLLEKEGVAVQDDQVVDFNRLFWDPAKELRI